MPEKTLYRISEAAIYLGVGRSTIYELLEEGRLIKTRVLPVRITIESLRKYRASIVEVISEDDKINSVHNRPQMSTAALTIPFD